MIYKVSWYNSDVYGRTEGITVIVQSKAVVTDEDKGLLYYKAKEALRERNSRLNTDKYESSEIEDVTEDEVLLVNYFSFI